MAHNAELKLEAVLRAQEILTTLATTSDSFYMDSLRTEPLEDESFTSYTANVSWTNLFGTSQSVELSTIKLTGSTTQSACDPFISKDWGVPKVTASIPVAGTISDLAVTPQALFVTVGSTTNSHTPTLLSYSLTGTSTPVFVNGFDNASTSRIGFSSIAVGDGYVFAGNAFTSVSAATCADRISCAQIQAFKYSDTGVLSRTSTLTFATTSPPFSLSSNGTPSPVHSLTYYRHVLYAGLEKTLQGSEFNTIDARNPANLIWRSGYRVGRTVNRVSVRAENAYVSTDDPARELYVFDIHDVDHLSFRGSWDAPGSTSFGYGTANTVNGSTIRFGRSYSSNAPEFSVLDSSDPSHIQEIQSRDLGTVRDPESIRALVTQSYVTFVLLTHRLEIWNTGDPKLLTSFQNSYSLPAGSEGIALSCRNDLIYVGRNTSDSSGVIDILQGSE
jgi:hypothetical protein